MVQNASAWLLPRFNRQERIGPVPKAMSSIWLSGSKYKVLLITCTALNSLGPECLKHILHPYEGSTGEVLLHVPLATETQVEATMEQALLIAPHLGHFRKRLPCFALSLHAYCHVRTITSFGCDLGTQGLCFKNLLLSVFIGIASVVRVVLID